MPHINWSIDVGGIIMAAMALVLVPVTKMLVTTLWAMRDTVRDLGHIVVGAHSDDSSALLPRMKAVEHEIKRHRDRLILIESEAGLKIQDRT